jgi:hypothetical protein
VLLTAAAPRLRGWVVRAAARPSSGTPGGGDESLRVPLEGEVVRGERGRPDAVVGNAALVRLVSARAQSPMLARTKTEHVEPLRTWQANLQILEDTVSAMLANEKQFNAVYEGTRYVRLDIKPLEQHIATAKPLLADVEAEKDPDTALKNAISAIKKGGTAKVELEKLYDQEAVRGARQKITGERTEREKTERKASEQAAFAADREREAKEKETKAAEAETQRQTEMSSLGITPNAAGPAYTRSNSPDARRDLLRYLQLRHPSFSTLSEDEINKYACFVYHLTLAQIERVEGFLEGRKVSEWKQQGIPNSRSGAGLPSPLVMASRVSGFTPEIGAEIFIDWAVPNPGHSSSITRIAESFTFTARSDFETSWGTVDRTGKIAYRYNVSGKRLVSNADRSAIITYYDGR